MDRAVRIRRGLVMLVFLTVVFGAAPVPARAVDPQVDPTCWIQSTCGEAGGNWEGDVACTGEEWGRCYVQQSIPIQIELPLPGGGATAVVQDFKQYVSLLYVWAIRVAAILAVVVIMVGGVMWTVSSGAQLKGKAQQLITNAFIGLLLAVGSFVILQTINPDIVRMSLPRTMMLRPISMGARFCSELDPEISVVDGDTVVPVDERVTLRCDQVYATPAALSKTCFGEACPQGRVCVPQSPTAFSCVEASFAGEIATDGDAYIDGPMEIYGVCTDGQTWTHLTARVKSIGAGNRTQAFSFPKYSQAAVSSLGSPPCTTANGERLSPFSTDVQRRAVIRGYVLRFEVDDSPGLDDWFAVGQSGCGGSTNPITAGGKNDPDKIDWTNVPSSELFTIDQLDSALNGRSALRCNLALTRGKFPDR